MKKIKHDAHELSQDDVNFIRNALRKASIQWPGRAEALKRARKKVLIGKTKKGLPKYKLYWQCAKCLEWKRSEKEVEVDHIKEIGSFDGDWNSFLLRMFPRVADLQVLCTVCHMKKTAAFNAAHLKWKRKPK